MKINRVTIRYVNLFFQINAFVEKFANMQMIFFKIFFSTNKIEILSRL